VLERKAEPGTTSLDLSAFPKGMYFVRYATQSTIAFKKVVLR